MASGFSIKVNPHVLQSRFVAPSPEEDLIENIDDEERAQLNQDLTAKIVQLLDIIPPKEADYIDLYFVRRKKQAEIAEMFNVSQAAVSYRLKRGLNRIRFLLMVPLVKEDEMREDLKALFPPIDINILVGLWETTCQSEVAAQLQLTQGRVRHRFFKAVTILTEKAKEDPKYERYAKLFSMIASKNFNILKEVKLPQWSQRGINACL